MSKGTFTAILKSFIYIVLLLSCVYLETFGSKTNLFVKEAVLRRDKTLDGIVRTDYRIGSQFTTHSFEECYMACIANQECGSLFFISDSPLSFCQLHSVVFLTGDGENETRATATYWIVAKGECPLDQGYIHSRPLSMCYRLVPSSKNWPNAKADCESRNSHLLHLKDMSQFEHIRDFLRASIAVLRPLSYKQVLIGGHEDDNEWKWTDDSPMTLTTWHDWEPTPGGYELCLASRKIYDADTPSDFYLNNVPCDSYKTYYLCQIDL